MKQGDILGFHAWNTRVFCVSLSQPRCKHEVGVHSSTQPSCGDPGLGKSSVLSIFREQNDAFPGSFHGWEREHGLVSAPSDST